MYVTWKRLCPSQAAARSRKNRLPSTQSQRVPRTIGFPGKQRPRGLISFSAMIWFLRHLIKWVPRQWRRWNPYIFWYIVFKYVWAPWTHFRCSALPRTTQPWGWTNERCTNEPVPILECPEFSSTPKFILRGSLTWTPQNVNQGSPLFSNLYWWIMGHLSKDQRLFSVAIIRLDPNIILWKRGLFLEG